MSDALPLPPRPNLEQYKKLAKDLQSACQSSDPAAIRDWCARWAENIARLQNLEITPELRRQIDGEAESMEQRWRKFKAPDERCSLTDAQFFVARGHGFASWPKFAAHLEEISRANSPVSQFEAAVDAIVDGNAEALQSLLKENPDLVHTRSPREHGSTLLHYLSANGIEDFRQKTPKNIVEIAKLLLQAGAAVNAESDAYGGRATTLGLTATSWHPEKAGVELPLLELLIAHGAILDGPDGSSVVNSCLRNGRGQAAEFLAGKGARLDLEGAAGVGRLDLVENFSKEAAMQNQMKDAFAWACQFGRTSVVDFLLQKGMGLDTKLRHDGQTGLHWASLGGHPDTVKLLLARGAPIDAKDEKYGGTPLGWALYGWGNSQNQERYYEVVALLVQAGAKLDPKWLDEDPNVRSNPRMQAAIRGE